MKILSMIGGVFRQFRQLNHGERGLYIHTADEGEVELVYQLYLATEVGCLAWL